MSDKLLDGLEAIRESYAEASKAYEEKADSWWDSLPKEDRELAFYSIVKRIYKGEIEENGSYRYVLYDVFGFDPSMYVIGMDCGYLTLHNRIMSEAEYEKLHADHT